MLGEFAKLIRYKGIRLSFSIRKLSGRRAAIVASAILAAPAFTVAGTPSSWLAPVNGSWTDGTKWSTNPAFPQSGYDATIAAPGSGYTISFTNSTVSSSSLMIGDPGVASPMLNGMSISTGPFNLHSGTVQLNSGTLSASSVTIGDPGLSSGTFSGKVISTGTFNLRSGLVQISTGTLVSTGMTVGAAGYLEFFSTCGIGSFGNTLTSAGNITAKNGGDVAINLAQVTNSGSITGSFSFNSMSTGIQFVNQGTLSSNGGTINVVSNGSSGSFKSSGTMSNSGTVLSSINGFSGGQVFIGRLSNAGTLIASSGGSIVLGTDALFSGTWSNAGGFMRAAGGTIDLGSNWNNVGTILADSGGTLMLGSGWTNSGTISVNGASVVSKVIPDVGPMLSIQNSQFFLVGSMTSQQFQALAATNTAAYVDTGATVDNTGLVFNVDANAGTWGLAGGTLSGGTVASLNGAPLMILKAANAGTNSGMARIMNATLNTDVLITGGGTVQLTNVTGAGDRSYRFANGGVLFGGSQTLISPDALILQSSGTLASTVSCAIGTLTLTAGAVARTETNATGALSIGNGSSTLVNYGTILAQSPSASISASGTFINNGTIRVINGSSFNLGGSWTNSGTIEVIDSKIEIGGQFTPAQLSNISTTPASTIFLYGWLQNVGSTLQIDPSRGHWQLGAFVDGGSLTSVGGGSLELIDPFFWGHVTASVDMTSRTGSNVFINGPLELGNCTMRLQSGTIQLADQANPNDAAIIGHGTIVFDGTGTNLLYGDPQYNGVGGGTRFTIGSGITIRTGSANGQVGFSPIYQGLVVNQGTISAQTPGTKITIYGITSSTGAIEASNGASINIQSDGESTLKGLWAVHPNSSIKVTLGFGFWMPSTNVGTILIDGPGARFSSSSNSYSLPVSSNSGTIIIMNGGTASFGSTNSGTIIVGAGSALRSLGLNNTGTMSIDGAFGLDYTTTSPLSPVAQQIAAGYADGAWNAAGINSPAAAADPNHLTGLGFAESSQIYTTFPTTFAGLSVDSTAVLVRYTLLGDANLDRAVDTIDFNLLAANFSQTGVYWFNGDFNYDSTVNTVDFNQLVANFGQAVMPAEAGTPAVVPESGAVSMVALLSLLVARRFRRRYASAPPAIAAG